MQSAQTQRLLRSVVDDAFVVELDPGLHDQSDDPLPDALETLARERAAMRGDGGERRLRLGDGQLVQRLSCAPPGTGTSVPITYTGGSPPAVRQAASVRAQGGACAWRSRSSGKPSGRRHSASSNRGGFCGSPRATYSATMTRGALEGLGRRQRLPAFGPEVITAEQYALARQAMRIGHAQHEVAELSGPHARCTRRPG